MSASFSDLGDDLLAILFYLNLQKFCCDVFEDLPLEVPGVTILSCGSITLRLRDVIAGYTPAVSIEVLSEVPVAGFKTFELESEPSSFIRLHMIESKIIRYFYLGIRNLRHVIDERCPSVPIEDHTMFVLDVKLVFD